MSAKPYLVAAAAKHPRTGAVIDHPIEIDAYSLQEAAQQALIELEARFSYLEQGYDTRVIWISPATTGMYARLYQMLADLRLTRMATIGAIA